MACWWWHGSWIKEMVTLRELTAGDVALISRWPAYPSGFEDLDYALRANGWLAEYRCTPDTQCFVAETTGDAVGFTILSKTSNAEAEFRIALRADKIGQGLGKTITYLTLAKGFVEMRLDRIHLIVRKNNPRAIRLYQRLGFAERGECLKNINGTNVQFLVMDLSLDAYSNIWCRKS